MILELIGGLVVLVLLIIVAQLKGLLELHKLQFQTTAHIAKQIKDELSASNSPKPTLDKIESELSDIREQLHKLDDLEHIREQLHKLDDLEQLRWWEDSTFAHKALDTLRNIELNAK